MSGQTVVLGGLIAKTQDRVPSQGAVAGRHPAAGPPVPLRQRHDDQRTELLIIMTPHIVRNEADADAIKRAEAARMSWCLGDVVEDLRRGRAARADRRLVRRGDPGRLSRHEAAAATRGAQWRHGPTGSSPGAAGYGPGQSVRSAAAGPAAAVGRPVAARRGATGRLPAAARSAADAVLSVRRRSHAGCRV